MAWLLPLSQTTQDDDFDLHYANQSAFVHFIGNLALTAVKQWTQDQKV